MEYRFQASAPVAQLDADCMVIGIYKDKDKPLSNAAARLDQAGGGSLGTQLALGDFNAKKGESQLLYGLGGIKASRVLLVGLGERAGLTPEILAQASRTAARQLRNANVRHAVSFLTDEADSEQQPEAVRQAIRAVAEALYSFNTYKSGDAENSRITLEQWDIAHTEAGDLAAAVQQGEAIAIGCHLARDLGNLPGNVCTPSYLAETASGLVNEHAGVMQVEILEEGDMEALGMGAFLSVSKGSSQPGKLVSIHYNGGNKGDAPVVLVGKGITFDTGGISIKPGLKMDEMKYDMSGAGSVLGTMKAIAVMGLPLNVIGVLAAAENMPSGHASKPGDIVTTLSGKTVEILNTDAEGRLVLCDALTYVERYSPAAVVDIATLTGAVIVALGHHISGLLSNNDALADELLAAGQVAGDESWRLPLGEKYQEQLKSNFADMANIGGPSAGTITAGCFLARFTENVPWAHLDVAGVAWDGGSNKGSTARPVPLLTRFLMTRAGIHA